jgi:hypothetical protein
MKLPIEPRTDAEMLRKLPRRSRTPGWFLRVAEVCNGHWVVLARDRWGREVSRSGCEGDVANMIEECEEYAAATARDANDRDAG